MQKTKWEIIYQQINELSNNIMKAINLEKIIKYVVISAVALMTIVAIQQDINTTTFAL